MGKNSEIPWTDHTFNPWWGCVRVSPGCEHCYAETFDKRIGGHHWGPAGTTERRFFGEKHWTEPVKWDAQAAKAGVRRKVFCASMADVFEDNPTLVRQRDQLFALIERTPNLDWLLLTKRPENILPMTERWTVGADSDWPPNVWIGTTVESQEYANTRIPLLLNVPATVRFLSCEPLLNAVDLTMIRWGKRPYQLGDFDQFFDALKPSHVNGMGFERLIKNGIDWVITGGESGHGKRFCDPDWMRSLRDQCQAAGVPFFMKQMDKIQPIPDDLLVREFPTVTEQRGRSGIRLVIEAAGC